MVFVRIVQRPDERERFFSLSLCSVFTYITTYAEQPHLREVFLYRSERNSSSEMASVSGTQVPLIRRETELEFR